MDVRRLVDDDRAWLRVLVEATWGLPIVSVSGLYDPSTMPGFVAWLGGERVGALTYRLGGDGCEVVTLNSLHEGRGVGSALLDAIKAVADEHGIRLWLITTNDNIHAMRFYQRRGMDLCRLHRDFVDVVQAAKPQIQDPSTDGIPFRHALEFSFPITQTPAPIEAATG
jgi:DNA-3-methyladenine glycosylase I